jgi:hypothetical protein
MDDVCATISFGFGPENNKRVEHDPPVPAMFDRVGHAGWVTGTASPRKRKAEQQVGTVRSVSHREPVHW